MAAESAPPAGDRGDDAAALRAMNFLGQWDLIDDLIRNLEQARAAEDHARFCHIARILTRVHLELSDHDSAASVVLQVARCLKRLQAIQQACPLCSSLRCPCEGAVIGELAAILSVPPFYQNLYHWIAELEEEFPNYRDTHFAAVRRALAQPKVKFTPLHYHVFRFIGRNWPEHVRNRRFLVVERTQKDLTRHKGVIPDAKVHVGRLNDAELLANTYCAMLQIYYAYPLELDAPCLRGDHILPHVTGYHPGATAHVLVAVHFNPKQDECDAMIMRTDVPVLRFASHTLVREEEPQLIHYNTYEAAINNTYRKLRDAYILCEHIETRKMDYLKFVSELMTVYMQFGGGSPYEKLLTQLHAATIPANQHNNAAILCIMEDALFTVMAESPAQYNDDDQELRPLFQYMRTTIADYVGMRRKLRRERYPWQFSWRPGVNCLIPHQSDFNHAVRALLCLRRTQSEGEEVFFGTLPEELVFAILEVLGNSWFLSVLEVPSATPNTDNPPSPQGS